jgi:hypothetical protein
MRYWKVIAIGVSCCCLLAAASTVQNGSPITGQWMIGGSIVDGKVELTLHGNRGQHGHFSSSSMLPLQQLRGLSQEGMNSAGTNVRFEVLRDAGALVCEGYFKNGNGAGSFTFSPDSRFVSEMQTLGYTGLSAETVFSMAVHDLTLAYASDLRALGIGPISSDQLIAMRIHDVSIEYIRDMKALGYRELTPDNLVAMRIHGVSTDFAKELKALGYDASIDQMVAMRIHGVTPEFAKELKTLGYGTVSPDQMIAMRIHGVSPEYIRDLQARGMKNLTIDQLVSLKIHGIQD